MVKQFSSPGFSVVFLLVDDFALMSYSAVIEPLRAANLLAGKALYQMHHIAATGADAVSSSGAVVGSTAHVGDAMDLDLLFVVAGGNPAAFRDAGVFRWLRQLSRDGVVLGGVSGGPVVLAAAGLMEKRRMTVHWEHAAALAEISPSLLLERTLYVQDRDRITCAGGTAPLDMMHALIAEHHGVGFARKVSDWFLHTDVRPSSGPQRAGLVERYRTTNGPVIQAIEIMENHIADPLELELIGNVTGLGTRQLNRLFRDKLGISTMAFYRRLRLEKAMGFLTQSTLTITDIALATGFSHSAHFAQAFRARYSATPSSFRRRER